MLGGVARATRESIVVVEAAGFDVVFVETVGVGQSEVTVADMVDSFLLLTLARAGDSLQGIKKGVLELADVIAVNKADGDHVRRRQGRGPRAVRRAAPGGPVGGRLGDAGADVQRAEHRDLDTVWDQLRAHRRHLERTGQLAERRRRQDVSWMWATIDDRLLDPLPRLAPGPRRRARGHGPPRRAHPDGRRGPPPGRLTRPDPPTVPEAAST